MEDLGFAGLCLSFSSCFILLVIAPLGRYVAARVLCLYIR